MWTSNPVRQWVMNDSLSFPQGRSIVGCIFPALRVSQKINSTELFMGMLPDWNGMWSGEYDITFLDSMTHFKVTIIGNEFIENCWSKGLRYNEQCKFPNKLLMDSVKHICNNILYL